MDLMKQIFRPENPQLKELVERGLLERVFTHPYDGLLNRYRLIDPDGVGRALKELGLIKLPQRH